eukprot:760467-Hanusia_phi.AAC.4
MLTVNPNHLHALRPQAVSNQLEFTVLPNDLFVISPANLLGALYDMAQRSHKVRSCDLEERKSAKIGVNVRERLTGQHQNNAHKD